jgi:predicted O-methyltransferase YrrM
MLAKFLIEMPDADAQRLVRMLSDSMDGFRTYLTIYSAVKIGLFDALRNPKGVRELAEELNCDEEILYVFCEALKDLGFLCKSGDKYCNTKISEVFLRSDSFYSQTTFIENTFENLKLWLELPEILRRGRFKRKSSKFFAERAIHSLAQNSLLGEIQRTVEIVSSLPEFKKARRLLDLGGGHGLYAIAFTSVNMNLHADVFDLPHVVEKTKEYIRKFNAEDRVSVVAGDFFVDSLGKGYDIVFSSYNPGGKKAELIPKIYSCLNEGGVYINKQYFGDGRVTTLLELEWNLWTFDGIEKDKKLYTFKNDLNLDSYLSELEKIGFEVIDVVDLGDGDMMIVARR